MPEKEGKDRMDWGYAFTNSQEKEMIEAAIKELEELLNSKHVIDIREDLFMPLSDAKIDGRRLILKNKGLALEEDRRILQLRIEKEQWADLIKKYKVAPGRIREIRKLIETPLECELREE